MDERSKDWDGLMETVVGCRRCPRLVAWREQVARDKRRAYRDWTYWGKPIPSFGDPKARLLIIGLAPAAGPHRPLPRRRPEDRRRRPPEHPGRPRGRRHHDEDVERPVSLLASRLTNPLVTDVRVRVTGVRLEQVLPQLPVDIFAGQDLVLLARYDGQGPATIRVEGRTARGPVSWSSAVTFPRRSGANAFVPRLWAAQRIGWLAPPHLDHRALGGSPR